MYYYFWSFMALTVFFGQLYVGYGYRLMHGSMLDLYGIKVDGSSSPCRPYDGPNYL